MKTIKGGYYIKARKIQESKIAHAPPYVREIWDWLIKECNHKITKVNKTTIKRGQCVRTFKDIQEGLCWYVGYRKEKYKKWQCEKAMKWLTREEMVATTKTTRGLIITISNYSTYQDPENYEGNNESTNEATREQQCSDTINKNVKNVKNVKKKKKEIYKEKESVTISKINMSKDKYLDNVNRYEDNVTNSSYHEKILKEYSDKDKGSIDEHIKQAINWLRINHRKRKGRKGKDGWLNYDVFVSNWLNGSMTKLKMRQKTFEQKQKERWEDYERTYGEKS